MGTSHAHASASARPAFQLKNTTSPSRLGPKATPTPKVALLFPGKPPALPQPLLLGRAKPVAGGSGEKETGLATRPQVLALLIALLSGLGRPIHRWQHWQVSWPWSCSEGAWEQSCSASLRAGQGTCSSRSLGPACRHACWVPAG